MTRKPIILLFAFLLAIAATAVNAQAETLAWNAVTTYTNGTSIGSATVTYTALATAMSWNVPAATPPVPAAPTNLRMN
jgi:hypothetical protein